VKILVIQLSRFGDLLQTTPMLETLRRRHPGAFIVALCRYNVMEVYRDNPHIDHLEVFNIEEFAERIIKNTGELWTLYLELKAAVAHLRDMHFDLVVNITHDRFSTFLAYLLGAPEAKGMILSNSPKPQFTINGFWFRYLKSTSEVRRTAGFNLVDIYKNAVGKDKDAKRLFFHVSGQHLTRAELLLGVEKRDKAKKYLAFQLGASSSGRCWPIDRFGALGDMLQRKTGMTLVVVGSSNETWMSLELSKRMPSKPIDLTGKTTLAELAAVLNRCSLLVTNDTGTMHLAAAVGTPCVALFMESANPYQTGPYGEGHIICSPELDCFPCPTNHHCPDKKCSERLSVETVYALICQMIGGDPPKINHPLEGQRVYRTVFDETGQFDLRPLGKIPLRKSDLVRKIYRSMWLKYSGNLGDWAAPCGNDQFRDALIESFREWAECFSIDHRAASDWLLEARNDLAGLDGIVKKGVALTDQVERTLAASIDGEVLRKLADEIGPVDDEIRRVGKSCIWATQLTSSFETDLEQAQDNDFIGLLSVWRDAYRELQSRIRLLNNEIGVAEKLVIH
jgi:ADP-heptose:LPS heptosyltransferase